LVKHGIRYRRVVLEAGQMLLAHGGCAHYGFSTQAGETYSFACNVLDEHWLVSGGPEFVLEFLEWVMDLAELPSDKLQQQLAAYALDEHSLRAALNTCPPAYTCCLLKAIRADLQMYVAWEANPVAAPAPHVRYTLSPDDVRDALANLGDALAVLHRPSVRQLYQRFYVSKADPSCHVCECKEEKKSQAELEETHASALALRRLHACMERTTRLVVGSGQGADEPHHQQRARTRSGQASSSAEPDRAAVAVATALAPAELQARTPISTTFGSVTATPLARLLDFLTSSGSLRSSLRLGAHSRFIDVGSGIGQVVLHVQLRCALAACTGVEDVSDRCDAADKMLAQLQLQRQKSTDADPRYVVAGLNAAVLDERLDRVRFERGRIEDHLDLLDDATHVFMFDCCFHPGTHSALLPRLCVGPPRIVVSCLTRRRMQHCWPTPISVNDVRHHFRLLRKMSLTLAGSTSTRTVFVYQATGQSA
jgi:SAM-dependent methyltransferase